MPKGIGRDRRAFLAALIAVAAAGDAVAQSTEQLSVVPIHPDTQTEEASLMRQKIERAGYSEIVGLTRDSTGTWRGRAKKGDRPVELVVDKGGRIKAEVR